MEQLKKIKSEIKKLSSEFHSELETKHEEARQIFEKYIESKGDILGKMMDRANNSKELTMLPNDDWFYQYEIVDFDSLIDTEDNLEKELLKDHLRSNYHNIEVDFDNSLILACVGPAIIICHDDSVFDQDTGKAIIKSKQDYNCDVSERNRMIEEYIKKTGCFPAVIKVDYYGNGQYVNTMTE